MLYCMFRKETVRFDSFRFQTFRKSIGSVRFGILFLPVRRGSACVFRTRRGSIRFGSVRFRVWFRPVPKLNGSVRPVRFGRFGSVSYSFLSFLAVSRRDSFRRALHECTIAHAPQTMFCMSVCVCVRVFCACPKFDMMRLQF